MKNELCFCYFLMPANLISSAFSILSMRSQVLILLDSQGKKKEVSVMVMESVLWLDLPVKEEGL